MTTTYEPIQISNHLWMIDLEIERLPVFKSITCQRSTLNPTAKVFVPNTPPLSPPRHNNIYVINDSQEQDNE